MGIILAIFLTTSQPKAIVDVPIIFEDEEYYVDFMPYYKVKMDAPEFDGTQTRAIFEVVNGKWKLLEVK